MRDKVCALVIAIAIAVVAGCANAGSTDPGCGECVKELAEVRSAIKALPEVKRLQSLRKYGASPTNGATVKVEIFSRTVGDTGLADDIAKIVWQSDLVPVDVVSVTEVDSTDELVPSGPYDFRDDSGQYDTYVAQWGARPVDR